MNENEKEPMILPNELSRAFAHNIPAMRIFAELPDNKRRGIIAGARNLSSKKEMKGYVSSIAKMGNGDDNSSGIF